MPESPWNLGLSGKQVEGLRMMARAYEREGTPSHIMQMGVAYLLVRDYGAASDHFDAANERYPHHTDAFYEMAGAAKWCMNEPDAAVDEWLAGLNCAYADSAGGVRCPLLLLTASVVRPNVFARAEAERLLTVRADDRRISKWPGAVAEFVIGRIDDGALRERCIGRNESDTLTRNWFADFHRGVLALHRGETSAYRDYMSRTAITSDDDFDVNNRHFLSKLWHAVFFIARHESIRSSDGGRT